MIDWDNIRRKRDDLLARSDWTQLSDNGLTDAKRTEWTTYRTALRDLPTTYASAIEKSDIVWPTKPS